MAKVHKVTVYLVDANGEYDEYTPKEMADLAAQALDIRLDITAKCTRVQSSEEFEWDDDLDINNRDASKEDFEEYLN